MKTDIYGQLILNEDDICDLYLSEKSRFIKEIITENEIHIPDSLELNNLPEFICDQKFNISIKDFDKRLQSIWFLPKEYQNFDIAKYVLDMCKNDEELQRCGQELIMFQERDMFPLLVYLKYLVDTMRTNNIIWGVGRGSSVASFVLYLIGIHKINSLFYNLSIDEFLK